jgi:thermostable 8-oxoguanine DNA glycosylase
LINIQGSIEQAANLLRKIKPEKMPEFGAWKKLSEEEVKRRAILSVLSPQTRASHIDNLESSRESATLITGSSGESIFEILRRFKIRFPKSKVAKVKSARTVNWTTLLQDLSKLAGATIVEERKARLKVEDSVFGFGLKTTSDFLKNIGFSKYLAVLDSRNLRFLKVAGLVPRNTQPNFSNINTYYEFENLENAIANYLAITVSELDERIMVFTNPKNS